MKKFIVVSMVFGLMAIPALANVTTGTWIMDQSNTFADGVSYGSVAISADDSSGKVDFTVDAFTAPYSSTSNFGIQTFGFNNKVSDPVSSWSFSLPSGWNHGSGNEDGFGAFLATTSGTGNSRQDPLIFSITLPTEGDAVADNFAVLTSGTPAQGNVFFAAHVAGFTVNGNEATSHFIGSGNETPPPPPSVPVPGAVLLGGIGVSIVGWMRKRGQL